MDAVGRKRPLTCANTVLTNPLGGLRRDWGSRGRRFKPIHPDSTRGRLAWQDKDASLPRRAQVAAIGQADEAYWAKHAAAYGVVTAVEGAEAAWDEFAHRPGEHAPFPGPRHGLSLPGFTNGRVASRHVRARLAS